MYDVFPIQLSLSASPFSHLCFGQIHCPHFPSQSHLIINQWQISFLYGLPGTKSYRMRVWSLISLPLWSWDTKTLEKACSIDNPIWIYFFYHKATVTQYRGKFLRRHFGLIGIGWDPELQNLVLIITSKNCSIPALRQGRGLTGGKNLTVVHVYSSFYCTLLFIQNERGNGGA